MSDRALIVAALIVGGAIVAATFSARSRYALSAAGDNVAWRMDTWSGQIDICAAAYLPTGPLVRCGAMVVKPQQDSPDSAQPGEASPPEVAPEQPPPALPPRDRV